MQRPGTMRRASGPTSELSGASQPSRVMRRGLAGTSSWAERVGTVSVRVDGRGAVATWIGLRAVE